MQFFAVNILILVLCFLVSSTIQLPSFTGPRVIIVPILGPLTFNNVFEYGLGEKGRSDSHTRQIAMQALGSVLEEYDEQHPKTAARFVLDMREVYLQESGQLPKDAEKDIPKAKQDLADFFQEHPELQEHVQYKFADLYEASLAQEILSQDDDDDDKDPKDWAHINPNDK